MDREPPCIGEMIWIPGRGPDRELLLDLSRRFGKPSEPLGEAWFMGETRYLYDEISAGGIEAVDDKYLADAFEEMIGGMSSFYDMDVWSWWYAYFSPRILLSERCGSGPDIVHADQLWSGLISLSWYSQAAHVRRYEANFAQVLSPLIMHPSFWRKESYFDPEGVVVGVRSWGEWSLSPSVATSLFLTWRYLHPNAIEPWLCSVLDIEDEQWRAHVLLWLEAAAPISEAENSNWDVLRRCHIEALWHGAYRWEPPKDFWPERRSLELIPRRNIAALRAAILRQFDEARLFGWVDFFAARPALWPQMELALDRLQAMLARWKI